MRKVTDLERVGEWVSCIAWILRTAGGIDQYIIRLIIRITRILRIDDLNSVSTALMSMAVPPSPRVPSLSIEHCSVETVTSQDYSSSYAVVARFLPE
jgi:hypothetical protein